jgi:hypothetical protein
MHDEPLMAFSGRSLEAPPFDAEKLTYAFGFPVPPPFVTLLNALCVGCGSGAAAYERVDDALGWHLTDRESLDGYDLSPPELFPFAATSVDGGHFGYVIHATERRPRITRSGDSSRRITTKGLSARRDDVRGFRDTAVL